MSENLCFYRFSIDAVRLQKRVMVQEMHRFYPNSPLFSPVKNGSYRAVLNSCNRAQYSSRVLHCLLPHGAIFNRFCAGFMWSRKKRIVFLNKI